MPSSAYDADAATGAIAPIPALVVFIAVVPPTLISGCILGCCCSASSGALSPSA
ncbi:hypothetical protein BDZ89DRAFT_1071936 [Hymenopellis radicata]|nr:hypothetical protein BDZ89DRAFT_1071936 [Hymenopellis radicata]